LVFGVLGRLYWVKLFFYWMKHTGHTSQRRLQHSIDTRRDDFIVREPVVVANAEGTRGGVDIDVHEALDA
jgi:hypothetical protein